MGKQAGPRSALTRPACPGWDSCVYTVLVWATSQRTGLHRYIIWALLVTTVRPCILPSGPSC